MTVTAYSDGEPKDTLESTLRCSCGQMFPSREGHPVQCPDCTQQALLDWVLCGGGPCPPPPMASPAAVASHYERVTLETEEALRKMARTRTRRHVVGAATLFLTVVLVMALAIGVGMWWAAVGGGR